MEFRSNGANSRIFQQTNEGASKVSTLGACPAPPPGRGGPDRRRAVYRTATIFCCTMRPLPTRSREVSP